MPFGPPTSCTRKIESRRDDRYTRDHPVFRIKRFVLLKIDNHAGNSIDHCRRGGMKTILEVTLSIFHRRCQLAHDHNQIFLRGQNFLRKEFFA